MNNEFIRTNTCIIYFTLRIYLHTTYTITSTEIASLVLLLLETTDTKTNYSYGILVVRTSRYQFFTPTNILHKLSYFTADFKILKTNEVGN